MANSDRLMNNLRVQLPGALDAAIQLELFNTVDEMCRTAIVWQDTLDVTLLLGQATYDIAPDDTEIVTLYSVEHATLDTSDVLFDDASHTLSLSAVPTSADVTTPLFLDVALTPSTEVADPNDYLPARLWTVHHQALLDGVLSRMLMQPAKPYSNVTLGTYHAKRFRKFLALARADVEENNTFDGQNWCFPSFA
jgi:hypothetical protein